MSTAPIIVWLRQDLRTSDHPALTAAVETGRPIIPVYILDDVGLGQWRMGGASRWWLHGSLEALSADLKARGSQLILRRGSAVEVLEKLSGEVKASAVYLTRAYEPWAGAVEGAVKALGDKRGLDVRRFSGGLLFEPATLKTKEGGPFKVFTPFWKACLAQPEPAAPLPAPARIAAPVSWPKSDTLAGWALLPTKPDWAGGLRETWQPGEAGAGRRLAVFMDRAVAGYGDDRNRPDLPATSMLSPHLHFGEMSPRQCWHASREVGRANSKAASGAASFLREVGWREFSTHLLFHFPHITDQPFRPEFASFPWRSDASLSSDLAAWQSGRTGYPIVDAGMRQLWHTGYMHNRVRMIVASFLTKHLRISWQKGAEWFWDTLVDADLANNSASWQWVAGSGADAAPYFRIFNPVLQGLKFDPNGAYVKKWVPELARLSHKHIHAPWDASPMELLDAGVRLGDTYPRPLVEHGEARAAALAAYEAVKAA